VIHVIIASLLFKGSEIFKIALLAIALFSTEVLGEYLGLLPSHPLLHEHEPTLGLPFVLTTLVSFWLVLLFAAFLGASIMKHNRAIKDELVQRQNDLIAADRAKMDFFRFVTHEVKSPVNTAQSAVETALELGGDGLPEQVRDLLGRAVNRLEQTTRIVKDLANLARGEMLKHDVPRAVDLGRLVVDVVDMLREQADRRGQRLVLHLPATPVVQTTNGFMVEKIFTNLIGNAVRYNRDGGRVDVTLGRRGDGVRLEVVDQGIGIEQADQERVFDDFFRAQNAQKTSKLGTGLGLPMVKVFADELGGHVRFASTPGEGTTFVCDLPDR
jgi:signal transduction histidine kinase